MIASALMMAVIGISASFLPQEILAAAGQPSDGVLPLFVQLTGALYVGHAAVNWMSKDSVIGGIYSRPLVVGNLAHFLIGALALWKGILGGQAPAAVLALASGYSLFALSFALVMMTSPVKRGPLAA
jgi:hypothetical protein